MRNPSRRLFPLSVPTILCALASTSPAQTVVQAQWIGLAPDYSDLWSNPVRWSPQQVPNNSGGVVYDVVIDRGENGEGNIGPSLESAVSIRNLSLLNGGQMSNNAGVPANLTVSGATTFTPQFYNAERLYGGMEVRDSTYTLGTFTNNAAGILTGGLYRIERSIVPAIMQWKNADVVENRADISLFGDATMRDQDTHLDALRNFETNRGTFELNGGRIFATKGGFNNLGNIFIAGSTPFPATPPATMTVNGNLTNTGTIDLYDAKMTVTGDMTNSGDVRFVGAKAKLIVNGVITQTSGTLILGDEGTIEDFRATAARIDLAAGTMLGGRGTMFCDLVDRGVLSPGNSPGRITVKGKVTLVGTTQAKFELGGSVADTGFDQVVQTAANGGDSTTLDGEIALSTVNGYVPAYGVVHRIVSAATLNGRFATVTGHQLQPNRWLAVTYDATGVNVVAALPGDANLSASVSFDDLLTLAKRYGQTGQTWTTGDFTGDGATNFEDLLILAKHYNQQQPSPSQLATLADEGIAADWALAQSLVPEPTAALAALPGLTSAIRRVRRSRA